MSIIEPIPDLQWGKGDWQDYISNWREKDAEYIQARSILRYQTVAKRTTDWPSPQAGQVTYNHETASLEMWRASPAGWVKALMFQYLTSTQDTTAGVKISHLSGGGKGLLFTPTNVQIDAPLNVMTGMFQVDAASVTVQSAGMKAAKFSTDSDELLLDTPLAVAGLRLTGTTGTVIDATGKSVTVGTLTSGAISASGAITTTGTLQGASVAATTGSIGGVGLAGNIVAIPSGSASANAAGMQSGQGYFYGDGNGAVVRQRTSTSVVAATPFMQARSDRVVIDGSSTTNYFDVYPQMRYLNGKGIDWFDSTGNHRAWIAPVYVNATDFGATNFPDGTLWIQP